MFCVQLDANNFVQVITPQPADISTCAMVIAAPGEIGASPFSLSSDDAVTVAYAVIACWGVGFAFRALIKTLKSDEGDLHETA